MKHIPVVSGNIESVGYDPATRALEVRFKGGTGSSLYRYADVTPDHVVGLLFAESAGSYLHRCIKPNYKYERVQEAPQS